MKWLGQRERQRLREAEREARKTASCWKRRKKKKIRKVKKVVKLKKQYTYKEYLLSPEWKKIRKRTLERANNKCEICKITRAYQVHHKTYKRLFNEKDSDLVAICGICHQDQHKLLTDEYVEKRVNEIMKKEGYR